MNMNYANDNVDQSSDGSQKPLPLGINFRALIAAGASLERIFLEDPEAVTFSALPKITFRPKRYPGVDFVQPLHAAEGAFERSDFRDTALVVIENFKVVKEGGKIEDVWAPLAERLAEHHPDFVEAFANRFNAQVCGAYELVEELHGWLEQHGEEAVVAMADALRHGPFSDDEELFYWVQENWDRSYVVADLPIYSLSRRAANDAIVDWMQGSGLQVEEVNEALVNLAI